ncbi:MAG: hypothetical protein U0V48_19440 [Anaerolineales bacterium]
MDYGSADLIARLIAWLSVSVKDSFTEKEKAPVTGFVLGIISLLMTPIMPLITAPIPILGIILSIRGKSSSRGKLAITAGILCVLSLAIDLYTVAALILLAVSGP